MVSQLAQLLRADRAINLPLVMLPDLAEHGEEDDFPIRSTPVSYPGSNITKPYPQLPNCSIKMVGPRSAQFGTPLCEHPADLIDSLELALGKAIQPVTDFRFELKVI